MEKFKKHLFTVLAGIISCVMIAMGVHNCNRQPIEVKIERDTVIVTDTTVHYYPKPVEVTKTKTEYRWLTRVEHFRDTTKMIDSVLVEVPIESKHYHADEYDAWVSGYEPSLDSIFIRQKTQYITETVTLSKPPNKWELDLVGGTDYGITSKRWLPFAGGELTLNNHKRLKMGIEGGVKRNETTKSFEPYAAAKLKLRVF